MIGQEPPEAIAVADVEETATPAEAESLEPVAAVAVEEAPEGEALPLADEEPAAESGEDENAAS